MKKEHNIIIDNKKKCSKCGNGKNLNEFHKSKSNKVGYNTFCKGCSNRQKRKETRVCEICNKNFKIDREEKRKVCQYCKISKIHKGSGNPVGKGGLSENNLLSYEYGLKIIDNNEKFIEYKKNESNNAFQISCDWCGKGFDVDYNILNSFINKNTPKFLHCSEKCKKENPLWSRNGKIGIVTYYRGNGDFAGYDTYAPQVSWCEEVKKEESTGALLVKCYKCNDWFRPTKIQVLTRLNGVEKGQGNFYCSDNCKSNCDTYSQRNYSKQLIDKGEIYKIKVRSKTEENFKKYYYEINPNNLERSYHKYHLDHKFSISDGFVHSVPVETISHYKNLQMIKAEENFSKSGNSSISLNELYYVTKG